jgi:hypothetical protein
MAMSTDANLIEYLPEILNYGIDDFKGEHAKAKADILRRLRTEWWSKTSYTGIGDNSTEMDSTKLTESQFTKCATYLVLADYALPQLTKWNAEGEEDRFQVMMNHYQKKYEEEFNSILYDGVEYDSNDDGVVKDYEKEAKHYSNRLYR